MLVITNRTLCSDDFLHRINEIASQHPEGIILREKDMEPDSYLQLANECNKICKNYNVSFGINGGIEAARQLGISWIHLSVPLFIKYHNDIGDFKRIGVSVHSLEEAIKMEELGASYLIAGHIFTTKCKEDLKPRGTIFLRQICDNVSIPVYGIGGIHLNNISQIMDTKAAGFCIMSELMECENPGDRVKTYNLLKPYKSSKVTRSIHE